MKYRILRKSSTPFDKVHEECGVFGIAAPEGKEISAAHDAYTALFALQHRGQEAAGIAVNKNGVIHCHKDTGLVSAVFNQEILDNMPGSMAIGHVRYSTTGDTRRENAQPISITHVKGNLAVAHNGNLVNAGELRREIELDGGIFRSSNDTEVLVYTIVKERLKCGSIEEAVMNTMHRIEGAYSLVVMSPRKLIAARDPHGFRPLCIGLLDNDCYIFASETCALDALGAKFIRDVEPGEVCVVENGELRSMHCGIECKSSACVFEYIYFARPDSIIDGASVELARQEAGKYLSIEHPVGADVVIGVPDSGIPAAIGYAKFSGIPYGVGLIKNRYIARTFIQPGQDKRERSVRLKLNALRTAIEGKRVIMVDDSIVRGTTCRRTIDLLWKAGAKEIHMRVSAPPFVSECYYGTDIDDKNNLIATHHTVDEIAKIIGVNSLGYLSIEDVVKLADNTENGFCTACFGGSYPTSIPKDGGKDRFECKISEGEKKKNA